jgi:hypothetical protein
MEEIKTPYISPDIEVIEFKTEKGFATSGSSEDFGSGDGSWS